MTGGSSKHEASRDGSMHCKRKKEKKKKKKREGEGEEEGVGGEGGGGGGGGSLNLEWANTKKKGMAIFIVDRET